MSEETTATAQTDTDAATDDATATADSVETTTEANNEDGGKPSEDSSQAPESYEKFTLQEGMGEMRDETFEKVSSFLKARNLGQEDGQELVALGTDIVQEVLDAQKEAHKEAVKQWAEDAKTDQEIGGEDFKEKLSLSNRVVDAFSDPLLNEETKKPVFDEEGNQVTKFGKFLSDTGLGNHPEMIRFMSRVGLEISEDRLPKQRAVSDAEPKSDAEIMFPTMK